MRRREVVAGLTVVSFFAPAAIAAQDAARIGCLVTGSPASHGAFVAAFRQALARFGRIDGQDLFIDLSWAMGQLNRLPALAEELARQRPQVVVTATTAAALAARCAMPETPIVSATLVDPIGAGLIESFARPGGQVTGISLVSFETLLAKQLDLARQIRPGSRRIGMLINTGNPASVFQRDAARTAAPSMSLELIVAELQAADDLDDAVRRLADERADIVLLLADALLITERSRVAALALAHRLPTMSSIREMTDAGALLSYGSDLGENWRRAAYFVDRILRGASPADLPVEQPSTYSLILNLRTAQALGIAIPDSLLSRADEVIE
ncbi:ABC transporter substrate-binding protein [Methylobacterium sp. P31]